MTTTEKQEEKKDLLQFLFVGSPLLDIATRCNQEVVDEYGLRSGDCIKATKKHDALFRLIFDCPECRLFAGGSSQNTARIAKWILGNRGKVSFAGCVGEDEFATRMLHCLQAEGVEPLYIPLSGEHTGICACVLSAEGERSMCARLGAAARFSKRHLFVNGVRERLTESCCIFIEGYFFAHSPDVIFALSEICSENQVFSMSLSAEYICKDYVQNFLEVLPRVDVLLSNEAEAKAMAEALGLGSQISVEEIACLLATKNRPSGSKPRIVLVTRGADPVLLVEGKGKPRDFTVPKAEKVVDTVGCGDAMAGAFLAVYVLTGDVVTATRAGILAAVEIVQVTGCSLPNKTLYPLEDNHHSNQSS